MVDNNNVNKKINVKELFKIRNGYLGYNPYVSYTEINLYQFFEIIFSRDEELPFEEFDGVVRDYQNHKYNAIVTDIRDDGRNTTNFIIFEDLKFLEEVKDKKFVITSPLTYIGRSRTANNSRYLYGIAFDLDGVGVKEIENLFYQFSNGSIPKPNIIVSSGNGLHLYYIIKNPIALFKNIKEILKKFKKGMTDLIWRPNETTTIQKRQYQGIFQGFRIPETKTKSGEIVRAFYLESQDFWNVRELNQWLTGEEKLSEEEISHIEQAFYKADRLSLKEAKEKFPEWYERRIVKGDKSRKKWHIKRALYDWWRKKITANESVVEGHRYYCIMSLAMFGYKCDIPYDEVKANAYELLEEMDKKTLNKENHFTKKDIEDALRAYKECYMTFPRKDIELLTQIPMPQNTSRKLGDKRIGQKAHLEEIRMIRDMRMKRQGKKWTDNNGRKPKLNQVIEYIKINPLATKYRCIIDTKISKPTVYKHWEEAQRIIKKEIEEKNRRFYTNFSEIPFAIKKRLRKEMNDRYIFWEKMTKEEKIKNRKIDYIHELLKLLNINRYEYALQIYENREKIRVKDKNFKDLKELIKRQAISLEQKDKFTEFCDLINQAKTKEKLSEICEKFNILPNLELF